MRDYSGRELKVGQRVAYPSRSRLDDGKILRFTNKMVAVSTYSTYRPFKLKYPLDLLIIKNV